MLFKLYKRGRKDHDVFFKFGLNLIQLIFLKKEEILKFSVNYTKAHEDKTNAADRNFRTAQPQDYRPQALDLFSSKHSKTCDFHFYYMPY